MDDAGVSGRRAASSASVIIIALLGVVFLVFVVSGVVGHFDMRSKRHVRTQPHEPQFDKIAQA